MMYPIQTDNNFESHRCRDPDGLTSTPGGRMERIGEECNRDSRQQVRLYLFSSGLYGVRVPINPRHVFDWGK